MRRYRDGDRVEFPHRVLVHIVAARYGTTPAAVRAWPIADYLDAIGYMEVTG
jgi:hypothetical protein